VRLIHAAQRLKPAALACFWIVARIDIGAAIEKVVSKSLDQILPFDDLLCGEWIFHQCAGSAQIGKQGGPRIAHVAGKALFPQAHFGKDEAAEQICFFIESKACVERELHVVGPRRFPRLGCNLAGLVIDDEQCAIVEAVDAIETKVEGEPGKFDGVPGLGLRNLKLNACRLVSKPFIDQADKTLLFKREITARHALSN